MDDLAGGLATFMAVHGLVDALEKLLGGFALDIFGDSDRDVHFDDHLLAVHRNRVRAVHPLDDLLRSGHAGIQAAVENHGEFIASPAADEIAGADLAAQASA